jgi:hypothetical protein
VRWQVRLGCGLKLGLGFLLMGFVFGDAVNESPEKIVLLQNSVTFLHNAIRDKIDISGLIGGEILNFQK